MVLVPLLLTFIVSSGRVGEWGGGDQDLKED